MKMMPLKYLSARRYSVTVLCICAFVTLLLRPQYPTRADEYSSPLSKAFQGPLEADDDEVIQLLRNKYMKPPSSKPYNFSQDPKYIRTKNFFSWPFIHSFTSQIFENQTEGFFVEAGALDGEYLSNSLWLEKDLNWTGLLVESDLYNFQELLLKNRRAWASNTCLSSIPYPKQAIMISRKQTKTRKTGFVTWVYRGSSHEMGYTLPPIYDTLMALTTPTYLNVQCFPFYSYLLALNITTVDLVSLDVQGSEMEIVQTIPFDKVKIRVLVIEHTTKTQTKAKKLDKEFVQYFKRRGYKLIGCAGEPDYIFILRNDDKAHLFKEIKKRCK